MSAAPKHPSDLGYAGLRMTADEYLALGETRERYELIDGVIAMSPSPTPRHQHVIFEICRQLGRFGEQSPGMLVFPDTDLVLHPSRVYRPDVSVYARGRATLSVQRLTLPPDLIIEVLSPGTKALDLITKRDDYGAFGVREYWAVDPDDGTARAWTCDGGAMVDRGVARGTLASTAFPGLVLDLGPICSNA
jgi:Uma2 family endonuclease